MGPRRGPATRRDLGAYLSLVKIEHSLFALPYAYVGMALAADGWPGWRAFLLVTLAMVGARTSAMAINRVVDARIDALNPRTASREIPTGRLTRADGIAVALAGTAALLYAGAALNRLTLLLLPVALLFMVVYPYLKRFTWACHLWLGATIGAAAAGGYIAVTGAFSSLAVLLWVGVGAWVVGFDVLYAMLDVRFDREHGVHSVPARFGARGATAAVAAAYLVSVAALAGVYFQAARGAGPDLAWPYIVAVAAVGAMLAWQLRALVLYQDARALQAFNGNLVLGPLVLLGTVLGLALA